MVPCRTELALAVSIQWIPYRDFFSPSIIHCHSTFLESILYFVFKYFINVFYPALAMFSIICRPVLSMTSSFVALSFQETRNMLIVISSCCTHSVSEKVETKSILYITLTNLDALLCFWQTPSGMYWRNSSRTNTRHLWD